MLVELRREAAAGSPAVDRRTTVGNVLLAWLAGRKGRVSDASFIRYETLIRLHLDAIHRVLLVALTPEDVREHSRRLSETVSPATVGAALRVLRSALTLAVNDGLVTRNPALLVPLPKRDPSPGVALTAVQVRHFLDVTRDDALYPLWTVLFGTTLRMGEALGLRWADLDLPGRRLTVTGSLRHQDARTRGSGPRLARQEPKTPAGRRSALLGRRAVAALDALPRDALYVFHRGHGRPLNPSTVQRAFAEAVERAGLPRMRLHDTRHTVITLMIGSGASLDDVKRAAGHSSITITSDTYGHLVEQRQRELADALEAAIG